MGKVVTDSLKLAVQAVNPTTSHQIALMNGLQGNQILSLCKFIAANQANTATGIASSSGDASTSGQKVRLPAELTGTSSLPVRQ